MNRIRVHGRLVRCVTALAASLVVWVPAASARGCSLTDPTCVPQTVTETVTDPTSAPASETGSDLIEDVTTVVDTVVADVEETIEPAEEIVRETLDDASGGVLPDVSGPVPGIAPAPDPVGNDGDGPRHDGQVSGDRERGGNGQRGGNGRGRGFAASLGALAGPDMSVAQIADAPLVRADEPIAPAAGIGQVIEQAARVAFPLLLTLLLALYVVVQHRIDSRDLKLMLSPMGPDDLGFS